MVQLFFSDINELPDYIDYEYSNKINIKKVQDLLNEGKTIPQISKILNIPSHRIHDAKGAGKIVYPEGFHHSKWTDVVKLDSDGNYIGYMCPYSGKRM